MKFFKHLHTINKHRFIVMVLCFKMGLYYQGLTHDLSKYSICEFFSSVKYFSGTHSPTIDERKDLGYSNIWMHHKGRNKHHYEYWNDYSYEHKCYMPVKIPLKYVKEMICDRIAASKVYLGKKNYTQDAPLAYFKRTDDYKYMHQESKELLESWLTLISEKGEKEAFKIIKKVKRY